MLTIVKIGGNIIDDKDKLTSFLKCFAALEGKKILVHGGGKIATDIGLKLGVQPNYAEGRRITDSTTLDLVTMVYGGLINKNVVAALQSEGCNAIGLTGADGNLIKAGKRAVVNIDYGFVGDVETGGVNTGVLDTLLKADLVPVFAALTYDSQQGGLLNTNADTIARILAMSMAGQEEVRLVYCFEKDGVLNEDQSVIPCIRPADLERLKANGVIKEGMIPKLVNACEAVEAGVKKVVIGNAMNFEDIIKGVSGTEIV
jgi:acetylglutamate kinase